MKPFFSNLSFSFLKKLTCESRFLGIKSIESNIWIKTQIYCRKARNSTNFERSENAVNFESIFCIMNFT